jgi:hypothetical protein
MELRPGKLAAPALLCLLLVNCAQMGPPLPPSLELPKPPTDLHAARKGNRVTLTWSEPSLTTDRQSARYIGATLICRAVETEISGCESPIARVPAPSEPQPQPEPPATGRSTNAARRTPQTYIDNLAANAQRQDSSAEITYAIEVLNRNGRGGGVSNRVHIPAILTLPPPSDLTVQLTGDGVVLAWTSTGESQALPAPGIQLRYRIYRRDESSGKDAIAGEVPLGERGTVSFTDSGFDWEKTYLYRITTVSIIQRAGSEVQVEGDDTAPIRVIAHDIFPPAVPTGLQAAFSGEGQKPFIDLIWSPVTNADLAGYNVYRGEVSGSVVKLNTDIVKSPSYRDSAVASGKTYTYSVTAVDVRGNESHHSEETSEPVP